MTPSEQSVSRDFDQLVERQYRADRSAVSTVTDQMVERAAQALCAADGGNWRDCSGHDIHRSDARAALEAALARG
jgi:hypothetical protein